LEPFLNIEQGDIGIAVVGLGVGEQHARAYLGEEHCRLRWLYDLDSHRSRELIRSLGCGEAAKDYEQILGDTETKVISIASYDDAHCEQVVAALQAGKHVFVEKPLCRSDEELNRIQRTWKKNASPHLASNLVLRAAPLYQWLKSTIDAGELGEIYAVDGDYLYGRVHKITEGWRKDVTDYSVLQGGGIHLVDLILAMTGQKPGFVTAEGNRVATADTRFRFNDFATATFSFPSGLIARLTANFGCVHRHQHVLRIFGTKATFIYDDEGPRLHTSRDTSHKAQKIDLSPLPVDKGELIPPFVRAILEGRDSRAGAKREFDLVRTCLAADESMKRVERIRIDYDA
jgi:predicted dehydrogenase